MMQIDQFPPIPSSIAFVLVSFAIVICLRGLQNRDEQSGFELTPKLEALFYIYYAITCIIITLGIPIPELTEFILTYAMIFCFIGAALFVLLYSDYLTLCNSYQHQPAWGNTGLLVIPIGIIFFENLFIGLLDIFIGLAILLYAIHFRKKKNSLGMKSP